MMPRQPAPMRLTFVVARSKVPIPVDVGAIPCDCPLLEDESEAVAFPDPFSFQKGFFVEGDAAPLVSLG